MKSKEEIRKEVILKRKHLDKEYIDIYSEHISEKIFNLKDYEEAECIFVYMDYQGEVKTDRIIQESFSRNKKVAIPKIVDGQMNFYYISNIKEIEYGYYGIREPILNNGIDNIAKENDPLIIIPGVAFDVKKHRIGHGKGFYDKYLKGKEYTKKIGVAFDFQIYDSIPYEIHDILPDKIITQTQEIF